MNIATCIGSIMVFASSSFVGKSIEDVDSCVLEGIYSCENETNSCCSDFGKLVCLPKVFLFSVGYTIAFGSLFLRTLRVHKIFNNNTLSQVKLNDRKIFKWLSLLLVIPLTCTLIWTIVDPIRGEFKKVSNDNKLRIAAQSGCSNRKLFFHILQLYLYSASLIYRSGALVWGVPCISNPVCQYKGSE